MEEPLRSKASLIEVDLAHLKAPDEAGGPEDPDSSVCLLGEGDQKPGVGFFFKVSLARRLDGALYDPDP